MRRSRPRASGRWSGRPRTPGIAATRTSSRPGSTCCSTRLPPASLDFRPLHQALRDGARNYPGELPGPARGRPEEQGGHPGHARLRRPAVLPARLLRVEAAAAVRVPRLRSGNRRAPAALFELRDQRAAAVGQGPAGRRAQLPAPGDQPRPVGQRPDGAGRRRDRLLPGGAGPQGAAAGDDLRRPVRPRHAGREVGRADARARRAVAGGRRPAGHVDRAQALLGGDVPLHERHQERRPGLQGVPPGRARRATASWRRCRTPRSAPPTIRLTRRFPTSRGS